MKEAYNREEIEFIRSIKSRILNNYSGSGPLDEKFLWHIRDMFIYLDYPRVVKAILELCNEKKMDILNLFRNREPYFSIDLSFESLIQNPQSFIFITDFGGTNRNTYLHGGCSYLKFASTLFYKANRQLFRELYGNYHHHREREAHNIPFKLRSYQLLCLYLYYRHDQDHASSDYEIVLQALWSSIPDPLLTYAEFTTTFKWMDILYAPILQTAWGWYCALIRGLDDEGKCPRSLKHLSRCTVRDSLKSRFQLPYGVEKLALPKSMKQYLLLKDFQAELKGQRQIKDMRESWQNFKKKLF